MASGITSEEFGGKLDVFDTGKKLYIITETPWYFWLTTIFFVLALISIPYLLYLMYEFYEKIPEADKTHEDKKYFNGGIAMTVILSIAIIAVIAGFIATEARKGGGKLDRKQLEEYGKSLIVKGAAVRTADLINANGGSIINNASNQIAKTVVNQQGNDYINQTSREKVSQLQKELAKKGILIDGTGLITQKDIIEGYPGLLNKLSEEPAPAPAPAAVTETPAAPAAVTETPGAAAAEPGAAAAEPGAVNTSSSPISLSRSYKRRKSPSSLKKKKKKASPKKKKSTSSRRK